MFKETNEWRKKEKKLCVKIISVKKSIDWKVYLGEEKFVCFVKEEKEKESKEKQDNFKVHGETRKIYRVEVTKKLKNKKAKNTKK